MKRFIATLKEQYAYRRGNRSGTRRMDQERQVRRALSMVFETAPGGFPLNFKLSVV